MVAVDMSDYEPATVSRAAFTEDDQREAQITLAEMLLSVQAADQEDPPDYDSRYIWVLMAMASAWMCGYAAGFRPADHDDPAGPDWPVVYIELPTGQVSWHMPQHPTSWDGHDVPAKYGRIEQFVQSLDE